MNVGVQVLLKSLFSIFFGYISRNGIAGSYDMSDFTFTFHFHAAEKEMATHSSVLAWRIPRIEELGGLPSMGLHRVGHD